MLVVMGEASPLIDAPVRAFQVDELRLFFESVKTFVARQKQTAVTAPTPAPEPTPAESEPAEERPVTLEEELPPPITPPEEPAPAAEIYRTDPEAGPVRRTGGPMSALLKLFSLGTLAAAGYWIYMNPTADPAYLIFVGVLGLGAALVEWHASNL